MQKLSSTRIAHFIAASSETAEPELVITMLAEEFGAELVSLQTVSPDQRLVAVAWHARSAELATALDEAAREGNLDWTGRVPEMLNQASPAFSYGGEGRQHSPFADLPRDAWVEHVALRGTQGNLRGVVTLIGRQPGCPQLSDDERSVLAHSCGLILTAASERWRASQLEQQLDSLTKISAGLASRKTISERLKAAVEVAQQATGFDSIQLLTWDPTGHKLLLNVLYIRNVGFMPDRTWDRMTREEIAESSAQFLKDPNPMIIANPAEIESTTQQQRAWMRANGIQFLIFLPLIFEGEHLGTLVVTSRFSQVRTESRIRSLTALGGHLAAILQLSLLLAEVEESYQRLQHSHRKTIETLALAAEMRDATTGRHLRQLERLSAAIGEQMGLSEKDQQHLSLGAIVHDIGKLHIPDAVLLKRGSLTEQERRVIQMHPEAGERILTQSDVPEMVRQVARWHHERWDGGGYPDGLAGDAIPLAVQIVTVADVFDALMSRRPYKEPWEYDDAIAEITRNRGTQLSPAVVDAFLEIIPAYWAQSEMDQAA